MIDENKQNIIVLGLNVNYDLVFDVGSAVTWSRAMLVQRILKKAGDSPIKRIIIHKLETSTEIANEFFATLNQRDTP